MSLIKDRKSNSSGAYERILGNKKLDVLISKTHATTISAGKELEKIILSETNAFIISDINQLKTVLDNKKIDNNSLYLISKKILKKSHLSTKNEPDFILIQFEDRKMKIIELKEGYVFDTKKSEGEFKNLKEFRNFISPLISYSTDIFICCFHINDKDKIFKGLKKRIPLENIMTGGEFCNLLNIDYEKVSKIREKQIKDNFQYFIDELTNIPEVVDALKNHLENILKNIE